MRDSLFSWAPVRVPPFEWVVEISFRSDAAETRCTYVTMCLDIGVRFLKQHGRSSACEVGYRSRRASSSCSPRGYLQTYCMYAVEIDSTAFGTVGRVYVPMHGARGYVGERECAFQWFLGHF